MELSIVSGVTEEVVVRAYADLGIEVTASIDSTGVRIGILHGEEHPDEADLEFDLEGSTNDGTVDLLLSHQVARKWAVALVRRIDKHLEEQEAAVEVGQTQEVPPKG